MTSIAAQEQPGTSDRSLFWYVLLAIPLLTIVAIYGLMVMSRLKYGYWPEPSNPDPKDVSSRLQGLAIMGMLLSLASTPTLLFGLPVVRKPLLDRRDTVIMLVGAAGLACLVVVISGDLGTWLLD